MLRVCAALSQLHRKLPTLRMEPASKQAIYFRLIWNVSKCLFVCLFMIRDVYFFSLVRSMCGADVPFNPHFSCFFSLFLFLQTGWKFVKLFHWTPAISLVFQPLLKQPVFMCTLSAVSKWTEKCSSVIYTYTRTMQTTHFTKYFRCWTNMHSEKDSLIAIHLWMQHTLCIVIS